MTAATLAPHYDLEPHQAQHVQHLLQLQGRFAALQATMKRLPVPAVAFTGGGGDALVSMC